MNTEIRIADLEAEVEELTRERDAYKSEAASHLAALKKLDEMRPHARFTPEEREALHRAARIFEGERDTYTTESHKYHAAIVRAMLSSAEGPR